LFGVPAAKSVEGWLSPVDQPAAATIARWRSNIFGGMGFDLTMDTHRTPSILSVGFLCTLLLLAAAAVSARTTTPQEAQWAVAGWLAGNAQPLGVPLGSYVAEVETVTGEAGEPLYYVVRLRPGGLVIVPADDLVEPILSFTADQAYEPSAQDPLTVLVRSDVNRRLAEAYAAAVPGRLHAQSATDTQTKWSDLIGRAAKPPGSLSILAVQTMSDVRVEPFLKTRWAQGEVCSVPCYNYFTPEANPSGCAATAMAQLMYYYRRPALGIGQQPFTIEVAGREQPAATRGGDGLGGPYQWADMVPGPDCGTTDVQRQAIGALCYDAGVAVRTNYAPDGSGADAFLIAGALKRVFGYSHGINGANNGRDIGSGLAGMINPNLDAQFPVILGITGTSGHGVLVDGYGHDLSSRARTRYHHLNMGWAGYKDLWYNLPEIGNYDTVVVCIYNIFPEGAGEIISGRVTDDAGRPLADVTVRAPLRTRAYETVTNDRGIYALPKLPSAATFVLQPEKSGFTFPRQTVATGTSRDWQASAGNQWAIDFIGTPTAPTPPPEENPLVASPSPSEPTPY
jgi:hypothetical protein